MKMTIVVDGIEVVNPQFADRLTVALYKKVQKAMDYSGQIMRRSATNKLAFGTPHRYPWLPEKHPGSRTGELASRNTVESADDAYTLERTLTNTDERAPWLTRGTWAIGLEKAYGIKNPYGSMTPVPYPWLRPSFADVKEAVYNHIKRNIGATENADFSSAFKTVLLMGE